MVVVVVIVDCGPSRLPSLVPIASVDFSRAEDLEAQPETKHLQGATLGILIGRQERQALIRLGTSNFT